MTRDIARKRVLLTGGARGIGNAIKKILNENGAYEVLAPSREELDLSSVDSLDNYVKDLPPIDILINNAGINILGRVGESSDQDIDLMVRVNLISSYKLAAAVLPSMKENKWGRIINISSIWGVSSKEKRSLYSMTKFGINGLTKALAEELGPDNVLVNSVCPGYVNTELTKKNVSAKDAEVISAQIPLRRFAEPEEIGRFVEFLVSEKNTYITGQCLLIDGGYLG